MRKSEELARRWMPGTRHGSNRPAWAHPEDLVKLLHELRASNPSEGDEDEMFRSLEEEGFENMVDIAWMHDLIEDGVRMHNDHEHIILLDDLRKEGFSEYIVQQVRTLTKWDDEEKGQYLLRVAKEAPVLTLIVKLVDRICNLREGRHSFTEKRWSRYVEETTTYIVPMLAKIGEPDREWLKVRLFEAMTARPVLETA